MSTRAAVFDLTIFDSADTPLFGTGAPDAITESDFQTPDPTLSHSRPYLLAPENFTAAEIDFPAGSSTIGAISVGVLDKRTTSTDQATGILTAQIENAVGRRAILRRYDQTAAAWLVLFDGVVHTYSVDSGDLVTYNLHLRDGREFERGRELFSSNFVIWGEDGRQGPLIDYGAFPHYYIQASPPEDGPFLVPKIGPFLSINDGVISHFKRGNDATPSDGIYWGITAVPPQSDRELELPDDGWPEQDADGLYYYRDFRIRWRAKGSSDAWTVLSAMPSSEYRNAVGERAGDVFNKAGFIEYVINPVLYFASTDPTEIPTDGQEIEFQVLAENITEKTPFFWDGGTLGDLLQEIVDGEHTDGVPQEQYDSTALTNFAAESPRARFILRKPVKDGRRWVEEHIYKAAFVAPTFNTSGALEPIAWRLPDTAETVPVLDDDTIQAVGEWEHGTANAIGRIEYTYLREHLDELETKLVEQDEGFFDWIQFWKDDVMEEVADDDRFRWERLTETEITKAGEASDAVAGAKTLSYVPITIRSIAGVDGAPFSGDVQDEAGNRLGQRAIDTVLPRFEKGAAKYIAEVVATDTNLNHQVGDWLRVRASWLPEYKTGKRGLRRYMQIYGISDLDPSIRKLYLVDGGVPDPTGEDTLTDPNDNDCAAGGTLYPGPTGASVRIFTSDGNFDLAAPACGQDLTVDVLLIAGGGGGGDGSEVGGGGGAGGVLIAEGITIKAGETIPVRIGAGGGVNLNGEDSILWVDTDGTALDPATDPKPAATRGVGGGAGGGGEDVGNTGGSGGGGGSGGSVANSGQAGGNGTTGQGNDGGDGVGIGGSSSCEQGAGGGGGSYAAAGQNGETATEDGETKGGVGGGSSFLADWGVTAGGGGQGGAQQVSGSSGNCDSAGGDSATIGQLGAEGYGSGGGGCALGSGGTAGTKGVVIVRYAGAPQSLDPPTISSTSVTDENQIEVCVNDAQWPEVDPGNYKVRVEYAMGDTEPTADSGDWLFAGYLEAPGCLKTDAVPTGSKVWTRAIAEADTYVPSEPSTSNEDDTTETPGLLQRALAIASATGIGTATWRENEFCEGVRIRAKTHADGADTSRPLTLITDLVAADRSYELASIPAARGEFVTVDIEAWQSVIPGYDTAVLDDSPLQYLRLGEGSGTTASDETANNNDGTYNGSPTLGATSLLTDEPDTAVTFDGTDDFVDLGTLGTLGSDPTRTFELWIKTTESGQAQVFGTVNDGSNTLVDLLLNTEADGTNTAGHTSFRLRDDDDEWHRESWDASTVNIYDGAAHHIVVVENGHGSLTIYVDGSAVTTTVSTVGTYGDNLSSWQYPLYLGAVNNRSVAGGHVAATIDEWAIYDTALSAARVTAHYDAGTAAAHPDPEVDGTQGTIYRVSKEYPVQTLARAADVPDFPTIGSGDLLYGDGADSLTDLDLDTARQLLQINAAGTAPEWTSDVSIPGTLDVNGAVTLDIGTGAFLVQNGSAIIHADGSTGQIGLGAIPDNDIGLLLDTPALAVTDNTDYNRLRIKASGALTIAASTTSPLVATVRFDEPNITLASGAVVTEAATVYVHDAPTEGTDNYALLVNSGATELGGTLDVTGAGTFDSTVTSVGAATLDTGANGSSFGGALTIDGQLYQGASASAASIYIGGGGSSDTTGNSNSALGDNALVSNTEGANNVAVGRNAMSSNTTGNSNMAVGTSALQNNTSGNNSAAIGQNALSANTTGGNNTAVGLRSLQSITTGSNNTALGVNAGRFIADGSTPNETGATSLFLGEAAKANADGEANQIVIGYKAIGQGSNTAVIGNTSVTEVYLPTKLLLWDGAAYSVNLFADAANLLKTDDSLEVGTDLGVGAPSAINFNIHQAGGNYAHLGAPNSGPTTADMDAGSVIAHIDETGGAEKLVFTAKLSGGSVLTGEVTLN